MFTKHYFFFLCCLFLILHSVEVVSAQQSAEERLAARLKRFPVVERATQMVDQILIPQKGLTDETVLNVMRRIPRHRFVAPIHQPIAYQDQAIAIGQSQTISPPYIVAYMTQQLQPKPTDKVLEIGTGSGYQAAVLGLLVDEVYTIEIVEPLGKRAKRLLEQLGMKHIHTRIGDGYKGWPEAAPFDSIIVTCSPESVPQPLVDQLREGGRMLIPLGERYQQSFYLCRKVNGKLEKEYLTPALFVPMTGEAEEKRELQPDPTKPALVGGDFETTREDGTPIGWHYARNVQILDYKDHPNRPPGSHGTTGNQFARFTGQPAGSTVAGSQQTFAQILQGFALDGRAIQSITLEYSIKGERIVSNNPKYQTPTAIVRFYDESRSMVSEFLIGRLEGSFEWSKISRELTVPVRVREAVMLIGLPAATGNLDVDNVILRSQPRKDQPTRKNSAKNK